jgi:hypothetical protein
MTSLAPCHREQLNEEVDGALISDIDSLLAELADACAARQTPALSSGIIRCVGGRLMISHGPRRIWASYRPFGSAHWRRCTLGRAYEAENRVCVSVCRLFQLVKEVLAGKLPLVTSTLAALQQIEAAMLDREKAVRAFSGSWFFVCRRPCRRPTRRC